jgi:soluble lytic murein transglycosylase-like protein
MASAGSYWAARAHIRAGEVREAAPWLNRAANYPRTFYGLIALRALGRDANFNWDMPVLTDAMTARLKGIPAGARAMELVAAGQLHAAEEELGRVNPGNDKQLTEALLAYANKAGLPALAMRLAEAVPHPGGGLYDAALYPMSPWQPQDGYKIDRALIHAIVRQESRFDPSARSRSGATGLMQLMPQTASYISGTPASRKGLQDPGVNLAIGQQYVSHLLEAQPISTDLFSLVVAYNAGPGNLRRWKDDTQAQDDPLLFIESIPVAETRNFAEKVMANYWIYRQRLKQPVPSLDAVADGHWARYVSIDTSAERAEAVIKSSDQETTLFAAN